MIKRILRVGWVLLPILSFFIFTNIVSADEVIKRFRVEVDVNRNSSLIVKEEINYVFDDSKENHGIFRNIPLVDDSGSNRNINVDILSIQKDGDPEPYEINRSSNELRIKIGDPDEFVYGSHKYLIEYEVKGAVSYFEDFDEIYWNLVGNQWEVDIENFEGLLYLPVGLDPSELQITCYRGYVDSQESCNTEASKEPGETIVKTYSTSTLRAGSAITLAVGFPKGLVESPSNIDIFWAWMSKYWPWAMPIIVLIVMTWLWYTKGRDPDVGAITARYSPPADMKPMLVGSLVDDKVHNRDITAGLIYLAQQRVLSIKRVESTKMIVFSDYDYELKLQQSIDSLSKDEKEIIEIFFGLEPQKGDKVLVSEVRKNKFVSLKIKSLKKSISKKMADIGLFEGSPNKIRSLYFASGIVLMFVGSHFLPILGINIITTITPFIVAGVIVILFSFIMPRSTKKGAKLKAHILGFKKFLSMTQKERLEFHNDPEKSPDEFMEYLPYAIALEVENEWAKQFEDVYIEPPSWYGGHLGGNVTSVALASGIADFSNTTESSVSKASSSGSGGGGFAGGGAGGGGGGSW